ncbi:MBL fold metallo-hydrolase [Deinococcus sp.]|uniref:MBL fold metallo-hydrolase n=1 Tax=Deinococcus sp. TaxID=47478 RepID=UPI003CC59184
MKRLDDGVFQLNLGKANVYLIGGPEGFTLVDAATHGTLALLERTLQAAGWPLSGLRRIVATHAHVDHVGGLSELQARSGAAVWAHHLDAPFIRRGEHPPSPPRSQLRLSERLLGNLIERSVGRVQPAASVTRELSDGETLGNELPGWELLHLPGHTPGHSGLWWPERRLLLGGDVMMHVTPWLTLPLAAYTSDAVQARASVLRVAGLRPRSLGLGHGAALVGGAALATERLAARLSRS